ncbi:hypothetical protein AB0I72_26660 [Nocardiopsis sp. NPDC049922]|uniref:DUF3987 domain-containing protein n=1 Tax=Nocardiopsis sp. NPDC049922 TaxID=3155157 RepID=UPI0033F2B33D
MGEITKALEPHTEGDPIGVLLSLMSMYSVAIGNGPRVRVGNDFHPLTVWSILVGETSSGRKGTATGEARRIVTQACPSLMNPMTHLISAGVASGAALVSELHSRALEAGWVDGAESGADDEEGDSSSVKISDGFQALLIASEYASILKRSRIDDSLGQNLRVAWEGDTISNITKKETLVVGGPHLGVIGHITPGELAASLSAADLAGGSANRFLWAYVQRQRSLPHGGNLSMTEMDRLVELFREAVKFGAEFKGEIPKNSEAYDLWGDGGLYEDVNRLVTVSGRMESFAGRGVPYVNRLAALYAISDRRTEISVDDLHAAVGVVKYMIDSVSFAIMQYEGDTKKETVIPIDPTGAEVREGLPARLLSYVKEMKGEVPTSKACQKFSVSIKELDQAAYLLNGALVKVRVPTDSRPSLRYRYTGQEPAAPTTAVAVSPEPERAEIREAVKAPLKPRRKKSKRVAGSPFVDL